MTDPNGLPSELEPELRALDEELRELELTERASFGIELQLQLEAEHREWTARRLAAVRNGGPGAPRRRDRVALRAAAAAAGLVLIGGWAVASELGPRQDAPIPLSDQAVAVLTATSLPAAPELSVPPRPEVALPAAQTVGGSLDGVRRRRPIVLAASGTPVTLRGEDLPSGDTPARLEDKSQSAVILDALYPPALREAGVWGSMTGDLLVDRFGRVQDVRVVDAVGHEALIEVAQEAAFALQYRPERRGGIAVASWVRQRIQFGVATDPIASGTRSLLSAASFDVLDGMDWANVDESLIEGPPDRVMGEADPWGPASPMAAERQRVRAEVEEAVRDATELLAGDREALAASLEARIEADPGNAVPYLALGRIRHAQGLNAEARRLFNEGAVRATESDDPSTAYVLGKLEYERALMFRGDFLAVHRTGKIPSVAFQADRCTLPLESDGGAGPWMPSSSVVAWNYVCPVDFDRTLRNWLDPMVPASDLRRTLMLRALQAAVIADTGDTLASVELMLGLADAGRWDRVLRGVRGLIDYGETDPYLRLLEAMAYQALGRSADAWALFQNVSLDLTPTDRAFLTDPGPFMDPADRRELEALEGGARSAWLEQFWSRVAEEAGKPLQEVRSEHLARSAYVLLRVGSLPTDAGEVWCRYGRPLNVRTVVGSDGVAVEFWDYGTGPDLTFLKVEGMATTVLTPQGRAYLEHLRSVLPFSFEPEGTGFSIQGS